MAEAIALEASHAEANEDAKQAKALRKHAARSQARPKLEAIEKLAQAELSIAPDTVRKKAPMDGQGCFRWIEPFT